LAARWGKMPQTLKILDPEPFHPGEGDAVLNRAMGEFMGDGGSWNAVRDAAGRTYYWDRLANATQWEAPTADQVV
jgi:hypothetical protein